VKTCDDGTGGMLTLDIVAYGNLTGDGFTLDDVACDGVTGDGLTRGVLTGDE